MRPYSLCLGTDTPFTRRLGLCVTSNTITIGASRQTTPRSALPEYDGAFTLSCCHALSDIVIYRSYTRCSGIATAVLRCYVGAQSTETTVLRIRFVSVVMFVRIVEQRSSPGPDDKGLNGNTNHEKQPTHGMDRPLGKMYARAHKQHESSAGGRSRPQRTPEIEGIAIRVNPLDKYISNINVLCLFDGRRAKQKLHLVRRQKALRHLFQLS